MEKEVKIFKALGHPLRLEIINLLAGKEDLCVCEIQEKFGITQSNLSQHLRILKEADILGSKKSGGWVHYSLKNKKIIEIIDILKES
ncbi:MAG: metalloregulator ArsR/SmtB family transcription factor [Bacilli bacterium]|uniref:ArsR/SmtB family transcription factor n=1 Tax=unclassified Cetobacterium TaxID=2630983 RepID=UPI00163D3463|nr:metalloregulator ArsR/SmtB family transcription factor [Cetobacterium sp. 2A]MBC2857196.1 winged helix-turn-helix transcriptional regulator [Cetobacterium sp. 2A]